MEKLPKLPILWKNTSNKSCSQLNFLHISQWVQMSIFLKSGTRGFQRLPSLNRFTLELNTAKNTHYIKKSSNKTCSELNFVQKSFRVEPGGSKDQYVWNLIVYRNGKLDSFWPKWMTSYLEIELTVFWSSEQIWSQMK